MSSRAAAWLAWSMCLLALALTALSVVFLILNLSYPNVPVYRYWPESTILAVAYSIVGALVASRRPGNPIGWVLCAIGLSWGAAHLNSEYATYALLAAPGSLPAGEVAAWIYSWLWVPGLGLIVFLALLFPNGRLPSPRWRPFAWLSVLLVAAGTIMAAFSPGPILSCSAVSHERSRAPADQMGSLCRCTGGQRLSSHLHRLRSDGPTVARIGWTRACFGWNLGRPDGCGHSDFAL
jgi:hypothetical protein